MPTQFTTIILAAGESSRMGRAKLFLPVNGRSLLQIAVDAASEIPGLTIVVTGARRVETKNHLSSYGDEIQLVYNEDWRSGMSASIAVGVAEAPENRPILIMLADQPEINAAALHQLTTAYETRATHVTRIATHYPEGPGVPAIFSPHHRETLLNTDGKGGAKKLLRGHETAVHVVTLERPPLDIDTPADYEKYTGQNLPE